GRAGGSCGPWLVMSDTMPTIVKVGSATGSGFSGAQRTLVTYDSRRARGDRGGKPSHGSLRFTRIQSRRRRSYAKKTMKEACCPGAFAAALRAAGGHARLRIQAAQKNRPLVFVSRVTSITPAEGGRGECAGGSILGAFAPLHLRVRSSSRDSHRHVQAQSGSTSQ